MLCSEGMPVFGIAFLGLCPLSTSNYCAHGRDISFQVGIAVLSLQLAMHYAAAIQVSLFREGEQASVKRLLRNAGLSSVAHFLAVHFYAPFLVHTLVFTTSLGSFLG